MSDSNRNAPLTRGANLSASHPHAGHFITNTVRSTRCAADVVSRFDGVKQTGPGRWIARCPAHDDKHPSLSVRELEDGRTLIHCFGGCAPGEVVSAVGLSIADLFPDRPTSSYTPQQRRGIHPADALALIAHEATVVLVAASSVEQGEALSAEDMARLRLAVSRITNAQAVAHA